MTADEKQQLACLAIGRLLRICSRPYQPGDDDEYTRIRGIVLGASEARPDYRHDWTRDRGKGAQGD